VSCSDVIPGRHRAAAAGAKALVVTVDVPVDAVTLRRPREGMRLPTGVTFSMYTGRPGVDSTLSWRDVPWLRDLTELPLILKGITHPEDAVRAVEAGCAGIVVSNHGGRQLDGTAPTAELLPSIVAAVDGRIEVYVDGGVRRGADVLRALALGATGVLVGRPVLSGLAVGGERGVARVLNVIGTELAIDAGLAGVTDLRRVPRDLVQRRLNVC
jgi:4-hydroxymandelate oxidase